MNRYICIHGHFYQPPRENPWLESIEHQETAYPYHDWNERITAECYGPNGASRILDQEGCITQIVSNYAKTSFNFGPTLLAWMERAKPRVYEAIIAADAESREYFKGHGSALAQAYNHSILPLCNRRDKATQVSWGIRDFERRFKRAPEGIWLPETAVDVETLEILVDHGITFTILAPHQAGKLRPRGSKAWTDVSGARIDPRRAYLAPLPSGRSIVLFFYDGPVSQAVAFEHLLNSGDRFAARLMSAFDPDPTRQGPQLVHIATDGETYGHHHRHGDMALAYALHRIENEPNVSLINYSAFLAKHPPQQEVEIIEKTSWSCIHGIERWRSDCGCQTGGRPTWNQQWRAPLRQALDWLAGQLGDFYAAQVSNYVRDPWTARRDYIDLIFDRGDAALSRFFEEHTAGTLSESSKSIVLKLLEMQRHALLMYTSCGWFFDEVTGIETVQIIRYAARAIQLAQQLGARGDIEESFLKRLEAASSNLPEHRNARHMYEKFVVPVMVDSPKLVAHYAVSSLFTEYPKNTTIYSYNVEQIDYRKSTLGRSRLAMGKVRVTSEITRESTILSFGILHLGDHNMSGGVRAFQGDEDYGRMCDEVTTAFSRADMPEVLRLLDAHFLELTYSMRSLFRDEQRAVLDIVVRGALSDAQALANQLYVRHSPLLRYLATLDLPLPRPLQGLSDFALNTGLRAVFDSETPDFRRARDLLREAQDLGIELDRAGLSYALHRATESFYDHWNRVPHDVERLKRLRQAIEFSTGLPFDLDIGDVQTGFYGHLKTTYASICRRTPFDGEAQEWCENFHALGKALKIRVPNRV